MFRLGADPEVFLKDHTGKHISAIGLIGADKYNPLQMENMPDGFTLQEDNVALEYGIPPCSSADEFFHHINLVMQESLKYVYTGLSFSKLSCTIFPKDQMENPLAYVFGCEPDFNAWLEGAENVKPEPPHKYMRSAGGHIHIDLTQMGTVDVNEIVKKLDLFLSVPLVLMDDGHERKAIYGKAGAHRKKNYGVEYRTPSNWWIAPEETEAVREQRCKWVWRNVERALDLQQAMPALGDLVPHCINTNDKDLALGLVEEFKLEVL